MGGGSKEWTQSPGSLNRHPVQQRPDHSKLMVPEINRSRVQSDWKGGLKSDEYQVNFKEERSPPRSGFISSSEDEDDAVDDSDLRSSGQSTTSSASFKSDWSKDHNPNFKGQSSLKVPLENQQTASTESDGRDGPTEEFRERKSSFKKLRDGVRRLLRRVSKNNMET